MMTYGNLLSWRRDRDAKGVRIKSALIITANDLEVGSNNMLIKFVGHTELGGVVNREKKTLLLLR